MTRTAGRAVRGRGFTLIELMVAVAIIGLLSSVAIPTYQRMTVRSKAAERYAILESIKRAVEDVTVRNSGIPDFDGDGVPDTTWAGVPNPPGVPGPNRRLFDFQRPGWPTLALVVEGSAYYTYWFNVDDDPAAPPARMMVAVTGDIDGDGQWLDLRKNFVGVGNSWSATLPTDVAFPPVVGDVDSVF